MRLIALPWTSCTVPVSICRGVVARRHVGVPAVVGGVDDRVMGQLPVGSRESSKAISWGLGEFLLLRMRPFRGGSLGPESFRRSGSCDWWPLRRNTCWSWDGLWSQLVRWYVWIAGWRWCDWEDGEENILVGSCRRNVVGEGGQTWANAQNQSDGN